MKIDRISSSEYAKVFQKPMHVYNSAAFVDTVRTKCEEFYFFLIYQNKLKIGLIGGVKEKSFYSPFSAPLGGFSFNVNNIKLVYLANTIEVTEQYLSEIGLNNILYTLPPHFYHERILPKQYFVFTQMNYNIKNDINYHFKMSDLIKYEIGKIDRSTRNNLRRATKSELSFKKVTDISNKSLAYSIIKINKEKKKRPLHMTFEDILDAAKVINMDYFLVLKNSQAIASAIVYHVAKHIVQIIYWGNIPESSIYRPMNFLAYNIFMYYKTQNIDFVDLGISSESGIPNYGLCDFKENIGCTASIRYTFTKNIS